MSKEDFSQLYTDYMPRLYGFCKRFGLSTEDAREIIEETFIQLWEQRVDLYAGTPLSTHLFAIARPLIYDALHQTKSAPSMTITEEPLTQIPSSVSLT